MVVRQGVKGSVYRSPPRDVKNPDSVGWWWPGVVVSIDEGTFKIKHFPKKVANGKDDRNGADSIFKQRNGLTSFVTELRHNSKNVKPLPKRHREDLIESQPTHFEEIQKSVLLTPDEVLQYKEIKSKVENSNLKLKIQTKKFNLMLMFYEELVNRTNVSSGVYSVSTKSFEMDQKQMNKFVEQLNSYLKEIEISKKCDVVEKINVFTYGNVEYIGLESRRVDYEIDEKLGTNRIVWPGLNWTHFQRIEEA